MARKPGYVFKITEKSLERTKSIIYCQLNHIKRFVLLKYHPGPLACQLDLRCIVTTFVNWSFVILKHSSSDVYSAHKNRGTLACLPIESYRKEVLQ